MATQPTGTASPAAAIVLRVLAAVAGGFGFTTAVVALAAVALPLLFGMQRSEAVLLSTMLGFIVYLVAILWAFAARRMLHVWLVFGAGGAFAWVAANTLAPLLSTGA